MSVGMVRVTDELIDAGRSERGGWSKAQLALLGVSWPPPSGWKAHVVGRLISRTDADLFIQLRDGGSGDYTTERDALFAGLSVADIAAGIRNPVPPPQPAD